MNTDAGYHFSRRKRSRLADDLFHRSKRPRPAEGLFGRRPHGLFLEAVPSCFFALPPIPPEAGSAAFDMGNFLSYAFSDCMPRDGGLGLYRGWVDASQDLTVATSDGVGFGQGLMSRRILDPKKAALQAAVPQWEKRKQQFFKDDVEARLQYEILDVDGSHDTRDLMVATMDGVGLGPGVLSRKILDPKKAALQAVVPLWEKRKQPFYKDALEKAELHDKRLGENEVEARLQYEILDVDGSQDVRDLTVATGDGVVLGQGVVRQRILDSKKAALEAVVPPWEKRKQLFYKDALEKAGLHDKRLGEIEMEERLQYEILDDLRKPKEDLSQFFTPLTREDEKKVHDCLHGSGSSQVLVLHESSNIEVSKEKIRCLRPHGWLNDEVINLYLELLKERGIREPKRSLKCHFFNTFFYKKLACGKNGYDYKSVKRWTTRRKLGYELIECDKVFVPVHQSVHWCLAIINMKAKTLQYLDSLGGNDPRVPRMLARYIVEEVKDKSNKEIDINSWTEEEIDYIPLQQNGYDCGMFMLKYMDFLSRGASLSFGQEHMEYFRKRTAKEILRLRAD